MFVFKKKSLISVLAFGSCLVAAPAFADNSSTSATSSDVTGYSIDPALSAGAVEVHKDNAELHAGVAESGGTSGNTVSAKAEADLHLWGASGEHHIRGVLFNPGLSLKLD